MTILDSGRSFLKFLMQALAAEDGEAALRGLPETKSTKYIEMGRHEMEVCINCSYVQHQKAMSYKRPTKFC